MRLIENGNELADAVSAVSGSKGKETAGSLKKWLSETKDADGFSKLTASEISLLRAAIAYTSKTTAAADRTRPKQDDLSDLLPNEVREWENEIDRLEIFAETNR